MGEIKGIWRNVARILVEGVVPLPVICRYWVINEHREHVTLHNLYHEGVAELGGVIEQKTLHRLLSRVWATYDTGETVQFGKFQVGREGLTYKAITLTWGEIDSVTIRGGYLIVREKGRWFVWGQALLSTVPNLNVFLTFLEEKVPVQRG